jgi:hypothetical protein
MIQHLPDQGRVSNKPNATHSGSPRSGRPRVRQSKSRPGGSPVKDDDKDHVECVSFKASLSFSCAKPSQATTSHAREYITVINLTCSVFSRTSRWLMHTGATPTRRDGRAATGIYMNRSPAKCYKPLTRIGVKMALLGKDRY